MTKKASKAGRPATSLRARAVVIGLLVTVCSLVAYAAVASYEDAQHVIGTYTWFRNNLHAGFMSEMCRSQIETARIQQCKYVLTGDRSHLVGQTGADGFLANGYNILTRMRALYLSANEIEPARELNFLLLKYKKGPVARQEKAEANARQKGDAYAAAQLKQALKTDADTEIMENLKGFKRAGNLKLVARGKEFLNELKRTSTNGALLAMLVGIAVLLGVSERLLNERRKAEETVLISEQRIRAVVDNMFDALLAIDEDGIIRTVNARAADLFECRPEALIGTHLGDLVVLDAWVSRNAYGLEVLRGEHDNLHERRVRKLSGEAFIAEIGMRAIAAGASMRKLSRLVTVRDISQRLEAQRMRQNFIDTATENLQAPLTEISTAISSVLNGGEVDAKVLETLRIAARNSDRLMTMLNDLLDLEKLESGTLKMSMRLASAGDIVDRSLESVKALAETQKVELRSQVSAGNLVCDGDRLVQVLVNFLSNAIKFSQAGKTVIAEAVAEDGWIVFRVIDQGRGIPEDKIAGVFERFKQAESSDARKGTGLGLPICKMLVENHGGEIGAISEVGVGTTFYARIPEPAG